jgi:hypothetical protein
VVSLELDGHLLSWLSTRAAYVSCQDGGRSLRRRAYRFVIENGADHEWAKEALGTIRASGFVPSPFDRPVPKVRAGRVM